MQPEGCLVAHADHARRAHAASAHAGPRLPPRCRTSMLLKAVGHQQLIASSWALPAQLGRALPRPVPWGPQRSWRARFRTLEGWRPS
jgi:hypothetical protein